MSQPSHTLASDAELTALGKTLTLPLMEGSEGEIAVDIGALRRETGWITMDPGYVNTGACTSAITFIDGEKGILRYRGYPIEQLAEKSSFLAVAWLLMYGELPSDQELAKLADEVRAEAALPDDLKHLYAAMPKDGHPMPITAAAVSALATRCAEPEGDDDVHRAFVQLLGKMPTIAAWCHNHAEGQPFADPTAVQGDYAERFLRMMFGAGSEVDPAVARALDLLLILHADHEQNCSTSTVRLVGSSEANLFGAISAGILALWGPLHGGANQAVMDMLGEIKDSGISIPDYIERVKTDPSTRLMGFGHRVYKNFDPRAKILRSQAERVLSRLNRKDPLLDIARRLEEAALSDPYFVDRKLYPNVDFYSGILYRALGIPTNMFTVMFALGRLPGWIAQWKEMIEDPKRKIGRPRQIYTGETVRDYVPMDKR